MRERVDCFVRQRTRGSHAHYLLDIIREAAEGGGTPNWRDPCPCPRAFTRAGGRVGGLAGR